MKPIVKWTIGNTTKDGYEALLLSIESFLSFYEIEVFICFNCSESQLPKALKKYTLINQKGYVKDRPSPIGVAWKLYPPRLSIDNYEISVDNDLIINEPIPAINDFLSSDKTLLLEDNARTYGRFEKHVPPGFKINSGLYGMPPGFNLDSYFKFYVGAAWEKNAFNRHDKNETFDEQGLIALALLNHKQYLIIDGKTITNCENHLIQGKGHHFIGLNRKKYHAPYRLYRSLGQKLFL